MRIAGSFALVVVVACSSSGHGTGGVDAGSDSSGSSSGSSSSGGSGSSSGGSQCPSGQTACNGGCCDQGAVCANDGVTAQCAQPCTTNAACPTTGNSCCALLPNGTGACLPPGTYTGQECLCATQTDCHVAANVGCCAPKTNATGNPIGPYVCETLDTSTTAGAYQCCDYGEYGCGAGLCCLFDGNTAGGASQGTSQVCFEPCMTAANCGTGKATCVPVTGGTCNTATDVCAAPAPQ